MSVILLINSEDPENMEIATDGTGRRLVFDSHDAAESWCESHAEPGQSYMNWDGER